MARPERESALRKPLTDVFGVDSNVRILRVLVRHGGPLAAAEIVRRSGLSRESVRLGLNSLTVVGIVEALGSSHARVFRFSDRHVLAPQIAALFEAEPNRFEAILDSIRRVARNDAILSLFVYGSVARGNDRPDSDLDIGLVAAPDDLSPMVESVREGLRDDAARLGFVANVVGLDTADVRRLAAERDPWWESVRREALVLSGRRPEDLASPKQTPDG